MKKKKKIKIKLSRIVFLIVLVAANTFAWFIYATKVDSNISVHVRAWNVVFQAGDNEVINTININVGDIYPGMNDYSYEVEAYNYSEVAADLHYSILEARILNDRYVTVEGRTEYNEQIQATDLTSEELEEQLLEDYPFVISFATSNDTLSMENGYETCTLSVIWPYENNQDELDTYWGIQANNYKESYPSNSSIAIKIKIIITQSSEGNGGHSSDPSSSSSSPSSSSNSD